MTTMTKVVAQPDDWLLIYTASGSITAYLTNRSTTMGLRVRVGSDATIDDADDAPADFVAPLQRQAYPLANGDKVMVRSAGAVAAEVTRWL